MRLRCRLPRYSIITAHLCVSVTVVYLTRTEELSLRATSSPSSASLLALYDVELRRVLQGQACRRENPRVRRDYSYTVRARTILNRLSYELSAVGLNFLQDPKFWRHQLSANRSVTCRQVTQQSLVRYKLSFCIHKLSCQREGYPCRYAISGYHSNELSSAKALHEYKLCSTSRMSEQSLLSVYSAYSVSTNILM
jgi:hypothetical protein